MSRNLDFKTMLATSAAFQGVEVDNSAMQLQFMASSLKFDPEGFRSNKPLRKSAFYSRPYLTCKHCNAIYFLDMVQMRFVDTQIDLQMEAQGADVASARPLLVSAADVLNPCDSCHRVDGFITGARDYCNFIEDEKREEQRQREVELSAAALIRKVCRAHLQRVYTRAIVRLRRALYTLRHRGATVISSLVRGRLARRRYLTEKHLIIIRDSHPVLLKYALKTRPGQARLFWYRRPVELQLVFANYLDLVARTGYQPPRIVVERNIAELSKRILARKNALIVVVQKRWRGYLGRRIVRYFRTEIYRIFSISVANAMKIQAVFRGHRVRRQLFAIRTERRKKQQLENYKRERKEEKISKQRMIAGEKARIGFQQERAELRTALYLDRIAYASELPGLETGEMKLLPARELTRRAGSLLSLQESAYGDDRFQDRDTDVIAIDQQQVRLDQGDIGDDLARRRFIIARIAESGPRGFGLRSGRSLNPHLGTDSSSQIATKRESSRSKGMRLYFQSDWEGINSRALSRSTGQSQSGALATLAAKKQREREKDGVLTTPDGDVILPSVTDMLKLEFKQYNAGRFPDGKARAAVASGAQEGSGAGSISGKAPRPKLSLPVNGARETNSAEPSRRKSIVDRVATTKVPPKKKGQAPAKQMTRSFAYPSNVNFNSMAWLYNDDEDSIYGDGGK